MPAVRIPGGEKFVKLSKAKKMNAQTIIPVQRSTALWVRILKRILKFQIVKHIAFELGIKGFDRAGYRVIKFNRKWKGEKLGRNEILLSHRDSDAIPEGERWVYFKPSRFCFSYNSRVDKGAALQASLMSNTALGGISSPAAPNYIALSTSTLTPAKGDTTLTGETSVAGLGRALGTVQNYVAPSTLDGAASYDVYKQFTLTGANTTVVSTALFDAASVGNMFAEVNFASSAVMATNDLIQVTWPCNL